MVCGGSCQLLVGTSVWLLLLLWVTIPCDGSPALQRRYEAHFIYTSTIYINPNLTRYDAIPLMFQGDLTNAEGDISWSLYNKSCLSL